jgi:nucleoid DNA-binding protein
MVINLRQNRNDESSAYGKYFPEVDSKEPLNLKGLAAHMAEHNKVSTYEMIVLVLGEMVKCLVHLLKEGQPVKLDGFGTFSPSVDGQGNGQATVEAAVAAGAENLINGIKIVFVPENTKGEKLTSKALKQECIFTFGYLVESIKRTVNGKERRFQNKTPLSYVLAPTADGGSGGNGGGSSQDGGGSQAQAVTAPQISGTTPFAETTSVSIQAEQGAEIRYTTDGGTPTAESSLYSAAITLSNTATVKAIAIKNGQSSEVASKTFTKSDDDTGEND